MILTRPGSHSQYTPEVAEQVQSRSVQSVQELLKSTAGSVFHLQVESIDVSASKIKDYYPLGARPGADAAGGSIGIYQAKQAVFNGLTVIATLCFALRDPS